MQDVVFSVATPTRNAFSKLRRCVGSVRGQRDITLEHLVNDACSTDGTVQWLSEQTDLAAISEPDQGMYDAINRAWARSHGQILSWLNSDEQYLPGTLAKVQRYFEAHPNVDVVFGNYIVTDDEGRPVALRREIPLRRIYILNTFLNAQSCTLFFRRQLLADGLLSFDAKYRYAADKDLVLRLVSAGKTVHHIPQYLAIFGIDGSNLSTHAQVLIEAEEINRAYGAFRHEGVRQIVRAARHVERLFRGGYRRARICYRYAVDERPRYVEFGAADLGGRYSLSDIRGHADYVREIASS
jgi:glycosyltransferase involved in cell wall biosynthesis